MSRSRSSCTRLASSVSGSGAESAPVPRSRVASACLAARDASRRSLSIARLRAVVMIQPAGLGGSPSAGQRSEATVNAS
jgi:hypothetical protein